jgi:putative phosphoesterase
LRILVIAAIHANWPALAALDEPFDLCLCLGDLVDYGPAPGPCIEWVRERAQHVIRGNHDHCVAQRVPGRGETGYRYLARVTRDLMWQVLNEDDVRWLGRLPVTQSLVVDGLRLLLVHATPRDPLDEYVAPDAERWAARLNGVEADVVCVGHTHLPFLLEVNGTKILNPGSIGQPRDGDPRSSYAVIENGTIRLHRNEYPVEETVRALEATLIPARAKQLAAEALRTGGRNMGSSYLEPQGETDLEPRTDADEEKYE